MFINFDRKWYTIFRQHFWYTFFIIISHFFVLISQFYVPEWFSGWYFKNLIMTVKYFTKHRLDFHFYISNSLNNILRIIRIYNPTQFLQFSRKMKHYYPTANKISYRNYADFLKWIFCQLSSYLCTSSSYLSVLSKEFI